LGSAAATLAPRRLARKGEGRLPRKLTRLGGAALSRAPCPSYSHRYRPRSASQLGAACVAYSAKRAKVVAIWKPMRLPLQPCMRCGRYRGKRRARKPSTPSPTRPGLSLSEITRRSDQRREWHSTRDTYRRHCTSLCLNRSRPVLARSRRSTRRAQPLHCPCGGRRIRDLLPYARVRPMAGRCALVGYTAA
jgi:hypothetical protein